MSEKRLTGSGIAPLSDESDEVSLLLMDMEEGRKGKKIFKSYGKWLYPLFEAEQFLISENRKAEHLFLHDKIAGRAAAALICRMGFRRIHIDLVSAPAEELFIRYGVEYTFHHRVDKIQCRTEDIITADMDLDQIYRMLRRRAKLTSGISLDISSLEAGYGEKRVLSGIDLSLSPGEHLVLTGDNGSGKTTLLKTIIGAVPPLSGEIKVGQKPENGDGESGSPIGYISQINQSAPFPLTAEEVVAIGLTGNKPERGAMAHQIEVAMRRTGCFHLFGRNFYTLSGGERQRVSLARCLCQNAGLILLDEPTSFLDGTAREELLVLLNRIIDHQMPTILLVSHDREWIDRLGWSTRNLRGGKICSN